MPPANPNSVLVRVKEWMEWVPVELEPISVTTNDKNEQTIQTVPLHDGFTSLKTDINEKLVSLTAEATGRFKEIEPKPKPENEVAENKPENEVIQDEEGEYKRFGLYLFKAVLAKNYSGDTPIVKDIIDEQRKPIREENQRVKEQGRDRRSDLVIAQHIPQNANRAQRRDKRRRK